MTQMNADFQQVVTDVRLILRVYVTMTATPSYANPMKTLRTRLSAAGVKPKFLNGVVLPSWWEDSVAATASGLREAASHICAHLGYSLASLLDEKQDLAFAHTGAVKYKKAKGVSADDVTLATHYAAQLRQEWMKGFLIEQGESALNFVGSRTAKDKPGDDFTLPILADKDQSRLPQSTVAAPLYSLRMMCSSARTA